MKIVGGGGDPDKWQWRKTVAAVRRAVCGVNECRRKFGGGIDGGS